MKSRFLFYSIIGGFWLCAVGAGMGTLWRYSTSAGEPAQAPRQWPFSSRLRPAPGLATLVMTIHPHCPCTRATFDELARLMKQAQGAVEAQVIFVKPAGMPMDWEKTDLWQTAAKIPGVVVSCDEGGSEAARFGAKTSGQVLLYNRQGQLIFSGGITAARGHSGDNAGSSAVVSLLRGETPQESETPVYGCPLFDPHDKCAETNECFTR